jgi:REP element-mobilizing transposase RayT
MKKTYSKMQIHFIFGTRNRENLIRPHMEKRLWSYIGAVGRRMGIKPIAIGGTSDHLHLLLSIPPNLSVSFVMQKLKSISSKWMNDTFYPHNRKFRWQKGYAAFSVGYSQIEKVEKYVRNQKKRHLNLSFDDELTLILEKSEPKIKQNSDSTGQLKPAG